jgi:hypothetical protein
VQRVTYGFVFVCVRLCVCLCLHMHAWYMPVRASGTKRYVFRNLDLLPMLSANKKVK